LDREYLTTFEAAKMMLVTPDSVLKWIKSGKLAARRALGGHYRIERSKIEALLKGSEELASPESTHNQKASNIAGNSMPWKKNLQADVRIVWFIEPVPNVAMR
jgi:excisionase family DNA binding protein